MKASLAVVYVLLLSVLFSCSKELSTEPPPAPGTDLNPPVVTTDKYLLSTASIDTHSSLRDSLRLVYNSKQQLIALFTNEGQPVIYQGHSTYSYNEAGKVILAKYYYQAKNNEPAYLSRTDSVEWVSDKTFISYVKNGKGEIYDTKTFQLNSFGQITQIICTLADNRVFDVQNKNISKTTITRKYDNSIQTVPFTYGKEHNPFYELYVQNPLIYEIEEFSAMRMYGSQNNATSILDYDTPTNFTYNFDATTGLMLAQHQSRSNVPSDTRYDCYFSYIKVP